MSTAAVDYIEPVHINDYLIYFYWGRHPDHWHSDMQLGGGAHALYKNGSALLVDTMCLPEQAEWVKHYLQTQCSVEHFSVFNTHWHDDHIAGNQLFADGNIIGHRLTREFMLKYRKQIEAGESGHPGVPVQVPNITFETRLDVWLDDLKVELHHFDIHAPGHVAAFVPQDGVLIAGDMLEDPVWALEFGFASPEKQIAEYERMMAMDLKHIFSTHCDLGKVKAGGYDKSFIRHNANYLRRLLTKVAEPGFEQMPVNDFIDDGLSAGELHWWEPYAEVHEDNCRTIARLYQQ